MSYDFEREIGISERLEASAAANRYRAEKCPQCGLIGVEVSYHKVTEGNVAFNAPFKSCVDCGFSYTDCEYEDAYSAAREVKP